VNPELEMGWFLTSVARYPHCVPVLGALEYLGNDGRMMTLAMVQAYVTNQGDGWVYTLGYLERFLEELRTAGADAIAAAAPAQAHGGFLALMAVLGRRTAELHLALAARTGDAAFDPEPLEPADIESMRERALDDAAVTLALLRERLLQLPATAQEDAQALLSRREALQHRISSAIGNVDGGIKTRYHGDYHLGQVLVADNDFLIIDFEGEPTRSFEERRAKGSPLRDVAGMLRSFNYARWSALRRVAQNADELQRLDAPVRDWELAAREAFLSAYLKTMAAAETATPIDANLLELFELEKALYELRYELNNRTDWVQVPLQGLLALNGAGSSR
jgi:maltose alpha-D-glucosyltransferase/alpha-amylase